MFECIAPQMTILVLPPTLLSSAERLSMLAPCIGQEQAKRYVFKLLSACAAESQPKSCKKRCVLSSLPVVGKCHSLANKESMMPPIWMTTCMKMSPLHLQILAMRAVQVVALSFLSEFLSTSSPKRAPASGTSEPRTFACNLRHS